MAHIVTILDRYDVVLIQEVKDKSQRSITQLVQRLNDDTDHHWAMVKSGRLGSGSRYKEQYVFLYKTEKASVPNTYQIPENEFYAREPFCIEHDCRLEASWHPGCSKLNLVLK